MVVSNEVRSNVDDEISVKSVRTAAKSVSAQSQASKKEIFTEEQAGELKEIASDIVTKLTSDSLFQPDQAAEEVSLASKKSAKSTKSLSSRFSLKSFGSKKNASSRKIIKSVKSAEKSLQEGDVNDITKMKTAPSTVDEEHDESDGENCDIIQERASSDEVEVALPAPKFE